MVHIGGWYLKGEQERCAGSYGCFGFVSQTQTYAEPEHAQSMIDNDAVGANGTTNAEYKSYMNKVLETANGKGVKIKIEKRTDYDTEN